MDGPYSVLADPQEYSRLYVNNYFNPHGGPTLRCLLHTPSEFHHSNISKIIHGRLNYQSFAGSLKLVDLYISHFINGGAFPWPLICNESLCLQNDVSHL